MGNSIVAGVAGAVPFSEGAGTGAALAVTIPANNRTHKLERTHPSAVGPPPKWRSDRFVPSEAQHYIPRALRKRVVNPSLPAWP